MPRSGVLDFEFNPKFRFYFYDRPPASSFNRIPSSPTEKERHTRAPSVPPATERVLSRYDGSNLVHVDRRCRADCRPCARAKGVEIKGKMGHRVFQCVLSTLRCASANTPQGRLHRRSDVGRMDV
jgi:hypothetical protein